MLVASTYSPSQCADGFADESNVLAKISPSDSKGVMCLEREARL